MTSPLGASGLKGYDFTRIKAFGQNYFITKPGNEPQDGYFIVYDSVEGVVWASLGFDIGDYIEKPSGAVSGDFLGYNGTSWVAAALPEPYLALFSAYDNTGLIALAGTTDFDYDTEVTKDTDFYSHSAGTAGVTVLEAGDYYVQIDISIEANSGTGVNSFTCWLANNGTEIGGTRAYINFRGNGDVGSCSIGRLVTLAANDVIKLRGEIAGGGTLGLRSLAKSSRMTITTLATIPADIPSTTAGTPMGLLLALTYAA